ncbi:hypothetical protein Pcinc_001072 [Petrolisthes cinctipes]|uniref:Uncharacterized protein n=1 Tax=Petrolisthes cinctipes TaxID=88211 RepID=A0AAE1GME6_PETCI|nr:hypothetical protein Pcinc_001072 [Petrolisthes cinctipes]
MFSPRGGDRSRRTDGSGCGRESLRTASGAAPPRLAAHPHPQQEAERLATATTFTTRGSSDQLPLYT